ncbi:gluconolactonase [Echinicola pacifica]|uniref:Gluconolactonase n=1 Tax=Echinicola pacifica TaxID=346377 RepID=A0A918Q728_9BACT|nr:SMP-30/gluconolactonase/LRE family protein [Echinicola pacifica]GGZ36096.1 gluconolactonase [Echinicola pacifica]
MRNYLTLMAALALGLASCTSTKSTLYSPEAQPNLLSDQFSFTEGPAVAPNGDVYFTDQPNNRIYLWEADTDQVEVFMENAGRSNGLFFDDNGVLYACADEKFELWKISADKEVTVVEAGFEGQDFNGPNDLWIDDKGGIYFTDPYYQRDYWTRQEMDMEAQRAYYRDPLDGKVRIVADHYVRPNGIVGTPDGKTLYITDIGDKKTYKYAIQKNGDLSDPELFVSMGSDGMTLDERGNLYLTGNGVTIFNPKGEQIGHIAIPERWTANITFGGKDRKTLFITASKSVYTLKMNVAGAK